MGSKRSERIYILHIIMPAILASCAIDNGVDDAILSINMSGINDGGKVAYIEGRSPNGSTTSGRYGDIRLLDLSNGKLRWMNDDAFYDDSPHFSSDCKDLWFSSNRGDEHSSISGLGSNKSIYILDIDESSISPYLDEATDLYDTHLGIDVPALSVDDSIIAFAAAKSNRYAEVQYGIVVINDFYNRTTWLPTGDKMVNDVAILDSGEHILYIAGGLNMVTFTSEGLLDKTEALKLDSLRYDWCSLGKVHDQNGMAAMSCGIYSDMSSDIIKIDIREGMRVLDINKINGFKISNPQILDQSLLSLARDKTGIDQVLYYNTETGNARVITSSDAEKMDLVYCHNKDR